MRRTFCFQQMDKMFQKRLQIEFFWSLESGKCLIWREGGYVEIYIFFLFHQMSRTQKVEDVARLASICTFNSSFRSSTSVLVSTLPYQLFTLPYPLCPQFHICSSLHTSLSALHVSTSPIPQFHISSSLHTSISALHVSTSPIPQFHISSSLHISIPSPKVPHQFWSPHFHISSSHFHFSLGSSISALVSTRPCTFSTVPHQF